LPPPRGGSQLETLFPRLPPVVNKFKPPHKMCSVRPWPDTTLHQPDAYTTLRQFQEMWCISCSQLLFDPRRGEAKYVHT
jgi:hypothetical protein